MKLITKVRLFGKPYTTCYITEDDVVIPSTSICKQLNISTSNCNSNSDDHCHSHNDGTKGKSLCLIVNAYFLQPFLRECIMSDLYRWNVLKHLQSLSGNLSKDTVFKLVLESPLQEVIDFAWNERMLHLVWSRVEIENSFSWLSTLGGAYSALGDYFQNCAEEAGKISERQYKLSLMLGDESLAARSKLYSAIAIAQKGNVKRSMRIVQHIAVFARKSKDIRLLRMCQGVWAKLKYMRTLEVKAKSQLIKDDGDK